jgi:chemotaxis protein methyltransferase CheR
VRDEDCVEFLRWALPRLRMRWSGFRRVRSQVCKRLGRRLRDVGLERLSEYRTYLESHPEEWRELDAFCRISISRFGRDRSVWTALRERVLPVLARSLRERGESVLRAWSIGCAAGEEPYTLALLWHLYLRPGFPGLTLRITATDSDEAQLRRAREALYPASSLRELPPELRAVGFERAPAGFRLRPRFRDCVDFEAGDVRNGLIGGRLHLVLCRNLVFTYFDDALQREILDGLIALLAPGGALVIGTHERLPAGASNLTEWLPCVYRSAP